MLTAPNNLKFTHPSLLKFNVRAVNFDDLMIQQHQVANSVSHLDVLIDKLVQGNQKFVEMRAAQIQRNSIRLSAVAQGQTPFAAVLNYAQLTTSTEEVFGQKFGELFVINSPGQATNQQEISSIEYSALMLGVNVVIVLGDNTVTTNPSKHQQPQVSIERNKILYFDRSSTKESNDPATKITTQVARLKSSPILRQLIQSGDLQIIGGLYDGESGVVSILG
jgi:carbonic anhydrase